MTTYLLALTGDEAKAARWAGSRPARLLSVSRAAPANTASRAAPASPASDRAPVVRDPAALAALLLRTLDLQDGAGVVAADFDSEEFAADVVARIKDLGRRVTPPSRRARSAFRALWAAAIGRPDAQSRARP